MTRIFTSLAVVTLVLLGVNLLVGLSIDQYNVEAQRLVAIQRQDKILAQRALFTSAAEAQQTSPEYRAQMEVFLPLKRRATVHLWLGISAALFALLVNSITITYFVGTSRWCREVAETFHLDPKTAHRSTLLKRKAFPWSLSASTAVILIAAFGALSDPATDVAKSAAWTTWHLTAAFVGSGFIAWSLYQQIQLMSANYRVIQQVLREVDEVRKQHAGAATADVSCDVS